MWGNSPIMKVKIDWGTDKLLTLGIYPLKLNSKINHLVMDGWWKSTNKWEEFTTEESGTIRASRSTSYWKCAMVDKSRYIGGRIMMNPFNQNEVRRYPMNDNDKKYT